MPKPKRGLNKFFAEEEKPKNSRLTAVLILVFTACTAALLAACGNGLKLPLSHTEVSPAGGTVSGAASSEASGPAQSASPSSSPESAPPASSAQQPEQVTYENAEKPVRITVSLEKQTVSVVDAKDRLVYLFSCSTGEPGSDTPTGSFSVSDKGKSFYNPQVQQGAYYWTRFKGTFLFHSLPFDSKQKMIPEEADKLGTPASHGCVRLKVEDAKWIYDNIPKGTKVTIE